ncbi:unnamed protein product [Caenorhabditis nigoni]
MITSNLNLNSRPTTSGGDCSNFDVQLWNLINLVQIQKTLTHSSSSSSSSESSEPPKKSPLQPQTNVFSIENILNTTNPIIIPKIELETDGDSSSSPSPTSSTGYTLDSLQTIDRRSLNKKNPSSSSQNRCVCDKCGKSYATTSNLSRHKQTHRALDSPHAKQCPHCDRVYVSMPALSMHILTHNAAHECNVCGKRFSRLWLLQGHLRSHTGIRPFPCAHCGKSFADRSNLRAHMLTHTGDKRFECDKCGRRFALRAYLNRHLETCK